MMNQQRLVVLVLPIGILVGCPSDNTAKMERLRAFLLERDRPVSVKEYRVLPPDTLMIRSLHVPEIDNQRQRIRPDGKINLPLLGEIHVAGRTPLEIEEKLKKAANEFYEIVDATVDVSQYNSQKIYVFGQVRSPGPKEWTGSNTLLDVLAQAQPTNLAWPERIRLVRGAGPKRGGYLRVVEENEAGQRNDPSVAADEDFEEPRVLTVDLIAMITTGDLSHNVLLMPEDVVYVPANPPARVGLFLQNLLFPVRPTLEALRVPGTAESATSAGQ